MTIFIATTPKGSVNMNSLIPVKKMRAPSYPLQAQVLSNPRLLEKLPDRWQRCKMAAVTAGLLASVSLSLSSCLGRHSPILHLT